MADADYRVLRTREERLTFARSMNLFSTPFMRVVFKDEKATRYVLRILTGKPDLQIQENLTEYRISKLDTKDAVLDVIAVDEQGVFYHIEIQLANSDDHIRRVRFYSAMVDSELLEKGTKYTDLPNTFIFYISMNDFMGLGEPIAQVESTIGKKKKTYEDGKHIVYVNAGVDDESEVARLMDYFKLADPNDSSHGELSDRVHLLKCEKEGEEPMCEVTQSFFDEGKIVGAVQILRNVNHLEDEEIVEIIKKEFNLNDFQAKTFVYPRETATA
ncbi:MAG: PD-(D/E)XK nuclease family transposase [Clostridia bacterium]|nr:PD-(D/E)XK nuclease family transposase [Clostridia bacterium]